MVKQIELSLVPDIINDKSAIYNEAANQLQINVEEVKAVIPVRRSIDARSSSPVFKLLCEVFVNELPPEEDFQIKYPYVKGEKKAVVIGFGPAGMYASLRLLELGIKPIVFERGKDVQARRKDLKTLQQAHKVNPDSNYCFGEGGAGTYSDGKLYTRATKRGDVKKVLRIFVQHGADYDILVDTHPHIGSNKLPKIVKSIRETIIKCGGEVHFDSRLTDIIIKDKKVTGVIINNDTEIPTDVLLIATGHSARDIFQILYNKKIKLESKAFAMGVRIEHPQELINEIQYHTNSKHENLPAASYNISSEVDGRGVYSFCMCPGGIIVPAATAPGEIVVNGMSLAKRDSPYANAGLVVTVNEKDWEKYNEFYPFNGLMFQQEVERTAFKLANNTQSAPAQRVTDFYNGVLSSSLPKTSYIPGLTSAPLHETLPKFIVDSIRTAMMAFNNKMKGFYSNEAVLVGVESRTSSPVRVTRNKETYMHVEVDGLFPCGEGAGYAGGIVSAALDGENCANAIARFLDRVL
jgi:uncharacterized FAD-dependent dehydrogenase